MKSDWSIWASIFQREEGIFSQLKRFLLDHRLAFEVEKESKVEASLNIALVLYLTQFVIASEVAGVYRDER